ncbi:MAG: hypothetical protein JWM32_645 [Verrucomicrobia bacterium]|nr:hypothetical protein [Verrucomicrobiota bacterium]
MTTVAPAQLEPELAEAYRQCADKSVLAALNPNIFFGYFSVCADPKQGHGHNTTFPGLDWGQSAEALLWLGRRAEVLASWEYVKTFLREDGLLPFAIVPDQAGTTVQMNLPKKTESFPFVVAPNGGAYSHWFPGNPLMMLPNVTFVQVAEAIFSRTRDHAWLAAQQPILRCVADWIVQQVTPEGLVRGGGFYVERPPRLEFDGVTQCYTADALRLAAKLTRNDSYAAVAARITTCFRDKFWAGDHCVEYINREHGVIKHHGFTDVDWAAIATGTASPEQVKIIWPQIRRNPDFVYNGIPTGISTRPETYEDWEMMYLDRHDLAAMGRVWYVEAWARHVMDDREGLLESLRQVARVGRANDWYWLERYYSERSGDLGSYRINTYCEYPANFIRIVHRFVLQGSKG